MIFSNYKIGAPKLYPPNAGYNLEPFCLKSKLHKTKVSGRLGASPAEIPFSFSVSIFVGRTNTSTQPGTQTDKQYAFYLSRTI
jgi:hypothetical protein